MRLHLIDGTYELFRAHFSKRPPHSGPKGEDLKATVGLVSSLLNLLSDPAERPTHLAVAFDNPIRSFRNELFDGYKTEVGVPEELLAQFDLVELATAALGVKVWSMREFEADDALASGAARFASEVEQVRILTPDKTSGSASPAPGWSRSIGCGTRSSTRPRSGRCAASVRRASPTGWPWWATTPTGFPG